MKVVDLAGRRFQRWLVVARAGSRPGGATWLCQCDCGTEREVLSCNLLSGISKSCGCFKAEKAADSTRTHGQAGSPLYTRWRGMIGRCHIPSDTNYSRYGAVGLTVCEAWRHDFEVFAAWASANGWDAKLTIDRIDNDKGYAPDNCRWVTRRDQRMNQKRMQGL